MLLLTLAAAVIVFAAVQDRVTAAGARQYVADHRATASAGMRPTIDGVVEGAVRQSVEQGLLWAGVVALAGCGAAAAVSRRSRRE